MMDAKKLMWDVGCGELTGDFYAVTPAQLENIIAKVRADALAQQGEPAANIPHTLAGFIGAFESETGHPPTKQEIWNGAIRSFRDLNASAPAPQPKGLFIDMITEHGPEFVAEIAAIGETAPQPAQSNQVLIDALKLCYEHCRVYHPEVETNNVGQAVRAALQSAQLVAAKQPADEIGKEVK